MTTRELLKRLPGLSRDMLYYWERRGWVAPNPGAAGARRVYSDAECRKIAKIWEYYQQGLRPEKAYERAVEDLKAAKSGRSSRAGS